MFSCFAINYNLGGEKYKYCLKISLYRDCYLLEVIIVKELQGLSDNYGFYLIQNTI